ncbi:hypothetical protein ABK040_003266 [Willaertia magna]
MQKVIHINAHENYDYIEIKTTNVINEIHNNEDQLLIENKDSVDDGNNLIIDTSSFQTIDITKKSIRFVVISDTHQLHDLLPNPLPKGDVLIHCGDFTNLGLPNEVDNFMEYLFLNCDHLYKYIILIPGNHEWSSDFIVKKRIEYNLMNYNSLQKNKSLNATYCFLLDELITIENKINIFGSKYKFNVLSLLPFLNKNNNNKYENLIPKNVNILLTHVPSIKGDLDIIYNGKSRGSKDLTNILNNKYFSNLKFHIFGHNHDKRGVYYDEENDVICINAVSVIGDKKAKVVEKPFVFDYLLE